MTNVGEVLGLIPGGHRVFISDSDDNGEGNYYFEGRVCDVPDEYMGLRVDSITAYDSRIEIEVC